MASLRVAEDTAIAAEKKLATRLAVVRLNWRTVKTSCRTALTGPVVIGAFAVAGAVVGARRAPDPKPIECNCVKASPSLLRIVMLAIWRPLLGNAVARALRHFGVNQAAGGATGTPATETAAPLGAASQEP